MKVDRYTKVVLTMIAVGMWTLILMNLMAPASVIAQGSYYGRANMPPIKIELTCKGCN